MAFGMSPFPLQIGTRGGGAVGGLPYDVDTGLLDFENMTQAQLQDAFTAFGITQTRTGTALRSIDGQAWSEVAENVLGHTTGSTSRPGLFIGNPVTNLCLYSRDMTNVVWTATNVTPVWSATGGFNGGGFTTLTATANSGTIAQAITDASSQRSAGIWAKRKTGTGRVWLSQNNGSTETEITLGSTISLTKLAAATLANPTVRLRFETSSDEIEVYNVNAARGDCIVDPVITTSATVARNGELCRKMYGADITDFSISISLNLGDCQSLGYYFALNDSEGNVSPMIGLRRLSGNIQLYRDAGSGATTANVIASFTPNSDHVIDFEAGASYTRARADGGAWQTLGAIPSGIRQVIVGSLGNTATANSIIYKVEGIPL